MTGRPAPRRDGRRALGNRGEDVAALWYEGRGFEVLDRQWRCREGEIDLVLALGSMVVFCEVKTRTNSGFGTPAEAVTPVKQRRIRLLATRWLDAHPQHRGELRFDVAAITWARGASPEVEIIPGAF